MDIKTQQLTATELSEQPHGRALPRPALTVIGADVHGLDRAIQRLFLSVLLILLVVALASIPWYSRWGLSFAWPTAATNAFMLLMIFIVYWRVAPNPRTLADRAVADTVLVAGLLLLATNLASPAQYLAVALRRPLIDPWLAAADAAMRIDVERLAAWTAGQPAFALVLQIAYASLLPQFLAALLLLGLRYRDRLRLWEYCFHFHFCLVVTLAGLAVFPAACAFQYLDFESVLPQQRFITHFNGLRDGTFTSIRFDDLEGLISMPSFHVAGGLMVTWVFRGYSRPFLLLTVLNSLMIFSTFLTGAHYFVDVLATLFLFALSIAVYNAIARSAVRRSLNEPPPVLAAD